MIRGVIFDSYGILADDDPIQMKAFQWAAEEEGLAFTEERYLRESEPEDLIRRSSSYDFTAIQRSGRVEMDSMQDFMEWLDKV